MIKDIYKNNNEENEENEYRNVLPDTLIFESDDRLYQRDWSLEYQTLLSQVMKFLGIFI